MDRFVAQDGMDFQYGVVHVDLEFTAGASGAVPSTLTRSKGIASVVKSTNDYVVTFEDGYVAYLGGFGNIVQASVDATKAFEVKYTAFNPSTSGAASVTLSPNNAAGAAQPLVVGDVLQFTFRFTRMVQPNQ